jgi:hypothetical protein
MIRPRISDILAHTCEENAAPSCALATWIPGSNRGIYFYFLLEQLFPTQTAFVVISNIFTPQMNLNTPFFLRSGNTKSTWISTIKYLYFNMGPIVHPNLADTPKNRCIF